MLKLIFIFLLCLSGCTPNTPLEDTSAVPSTPDPAETKQPSIQHVQWYTEKNYIDRLIFLDKRIDTFIPEYALQIGDHELTLEMNGNTLTYVYDTQFLTTQRTDEFQYVKQGELKQGILHYRFDEHGTMPIIYGTFTNGSDTYPIAFDWKTKTIVDNEAGSQTISKPMKFIKGLTDRITFEFIETYNQLNLQKQLLDEWYSIYSSVKTQNDVKQIKNAYDINLDTSMLYQDYTFRKNINTYALKPRVISINEDFFIPLYDASALEKTLFIAANLQQEFSSSETINWNDMLVEIIGITSSGWCEGLDCTLHQEKIHLNYSNQNGYLALSHLDDLNQTAYHLSGLENVYTPQNDQSCIDKALYDSDFNGYITYTPDGEFVNHDPGIIILSKQEHDHEIIVDMIVYQTEWKERQFWLNDMKLADESEINYPGDEMRMAYDYLMNHPNFLPHWRVVLQKQNAEVYRFVSMQKVN